MKGDPCSVADCGRISLPRSEWCFNHKRRYKRHGDPLRVDRPNWKGGQRSHPLYQAWLSMIARCHDERNLAYDNYGGRGIKVCPEWRRDFWAFVGDMGPRPEGTLRNGRSAYSVDRIDNDGNYAPENCRWATMAEQAQNKRPPKNPEVCKNGHPFTVDSTYWAGPRQQWKTCRICTNESAARHREKKRQVGRSQTMTEGIDVQEAEDGA